MNSLKSIGLAIVLCLVASGEGRAELVLTLSSTTPDLGHIQIGDTVSFGVTLLGLNLGDTLDFLAAEVKFEASLFGTPTSLTPGPIILDLSGFSSSSPPGLPNANYDYLFADTGARILSNGLFFSFNVVATAAGSGTTQISFADSTMSDATVTPRVANSLAFNILEPSAVPEPSTFILGAMGCGFLWVIRRAARPEPQSGVPRRGVAVHGIGS